MRARRLRSTSTDAERLLWSALRDRRFGDRKFRRQFAIGPFYADFVCWDSKLVIEIDGGQHFEPDALRADANRTAVIERAGYTVLRYTNDEVLTSFNAVLTSLLNRFENQKDPT